MFVMNADGSDQRQLTFTSARDRTSAWSADGTQVLYDKEFSEIYAINADGSGGERKLADGLFPGTSPYGDKVAFTASAVGLITIKLDGSSRFQVTRGDADWSANWSPGGTDLVFTRPVTEADRDIFRVHANGLGVVQLTSTPSRVEVGPVWSPDGTKIAFLGCSLPLGGSDCGIYTMNRDGSGETQVPNVSASFAEANLDWQPLPPRPQDGAPATLTVALAPRGAGVVTSTPQGLECPSVCSAEFDRGSSVRLDARPTGGLAFLGWTGACSGRSPSCSVSMDGEKRVGARSDEALQAHRVGEGSRPRGELSIGDRVRLAVHGHVQPRCTRCSPGATGQGGEACPLGRRLQGLADVHVANDCGSRCDGAVPALRRPCGTHGIQARVLKMMYAGCGFAPAKHPAPSAVAAEFPRCASAV